ncbi:MAG TPA: hypothetical protein PLE74_00980 [Candidatus Cloacimonadota bacterium]|nr:hypothetical protein [Candidatus Cloacimonadota bacterium]
MITIHKVDLFFILIAIVVSFFIVLLIATLVKHDRRIKALENKNMIRAIIYDGKLYEVKEIK